MTSTESKFEWLYTTVAVIIAVAVYLFLSVVVIRPLTTPWTLVTAIIYGVVGVALICSIDVIRQRLRRMVERIHRGRALAIEALESEIADVFMSQEQMYTTCVELTSVLRIHLGCNDARVILRLRGRYCTIHHD